MISKRVLFFAAALLAVSATSVMAQAVVNVDDFVVNTLSIYPGSTLDVAEYGIATVTSYDSVLAYVQGGSIISTKAATDPSGLQTLAVIRGQDYLDAIGTDFHGHTVAPTDAMVARRYYGDANMDGYVNYDDYGYVDAGFGTNASWVLGDMDHSGSVNYDDYGYVDAGFGFGPMTAAAASAPAPVPEPATLVLLIGVALAGVGAYLRKR